MCIAEQPYSKASIMDPVEPIKIETFWFKFFVIGLFLNTSNIFPVCQAQCDGILIAQAYNPELDNPINRDFVAAYTAENKKAPPQFTAQAFTGIQVFVEALKRVDDKNKLSTLSLEQIRQQLNQEILAGKYVTVLGDIAFTPEGEIIQDKFSVAQIKMDTDGKNGKFTFVKN